MLVLQRNPDQSITMILATGERILVRVKDLSAKSVRLCIDSPDDVRVFRTELVHRPDFILPRIKEAKK